MRVRRFFLLLMVLLLMIGTCLPAYASETNPTVETVASEKSDTEATASSVSEPSDSTVEMTAAFVTAEDPGEYAISTFADIYGTTGTLNHMDLVLPTPFTARYTDTAGNSHYTEIRRISYHYVDTDNQWPYDYENILFCLEPDKSFSNGVGHSGDTGVGITGSGSTTGKAVWYGLTQNQRTAIGLVLLYGCPTQLWDSSYGTTNDAANPNIGYRAATQAIVWEIVMGFRSATAPYSVTNTSLKSACTGINVGANGTDYFLKAYNSITASMQAHNTIPSFTASTTAAAPTVTVDGTSKTVTDTNGVLSAFSIANGSGVTFEKSGNNLKVNVANTLSKTSFTAVKTVPSPTASVYQLWYNGLDPSYQSAILVYAPETENVKAYFNVEKKISKYPFTLQKSIDATAECIAQIKGNPMYSLAGAKYQVIVNGAVAETLTTDANGKATSSKEYTIGSSVIVKEVTAPKGFKLNTTPYTFTIGNNNSFSVKDEPLFDPPFAITKVDKNTTNPQGDTSFSGAIFKWEYFANENWSGNATRTWHFKTNQNGMARYDEAFLASGYESDALYEVSNGNYQIPLGTVKITEIKNSLGYIVIPKPLYCSIVADTSSVKIVWDTESSKIMSDMATGNYGVYEPIDETLLGSLTVDKVDAIIGTAQGGATLKGAKFQVINNSANSVKIGDFPEAAPGAVCYEFTTDANGHYATGSIFPLGSYTVKEATPPAGYTLNSSWSQSFTVTADQQDFSFTKSNSKACANTPIMGGIKIIKQDSVLGQNTGSNALLAGITFSVISENEQPVVVNGTTYQKGATVLTMEVKWDGSQWTASSGDATLPYGTYTVKENPAPGSAFPNPYYQLNATPQTVKIQENKKVSELTFSNILRPGSITINKATNTGANKGNWKFDLYNSSKTYVGTYTTADNGTVTISNLVPGVYYLTEQDRNDPYWVCDGEEKKVTVNPAEDTPITFTNTHYGMLQIRKEMVTDDPVEGWPFQVTRLSDNADMGVLVSSADGTILSGKLLPGDYLVKEIFEENSLYYCKTENPVTVTITAGETATVSFTNALRPGKITIEKVNHEGEHLAGAKFLLEWSEDGESWAPVAFSDKEDVVKGCSTAAGLEDGCLITDETGIITFSTLYPGLQYRVTELEAPEGYTMLTDYAFVGELPIEDLTVSKEAVNGRAYILPPTGMEGHKMIAIGTCLAVLPVAGLCLLVIARRKKRRG